MNNHYYEPDKNIDEHDDDFDFGLFDIENLPYKTIDRGDFHIGQSYSNKPNKTIICKNCGNDKFLVGKGSYHTAIKCINCQWELCINDG